MTEQEKTLCAKGLYKSYGKKEVLKNLDIEIAPGHVYGLLGRNGAGKTTLMSVLTGQSPANAGAVTYGGQPVWENREVLRQLCFSRELSLTTTGGLQNSNTIKDYLECARIFYGGWDEAYAQKLLREFKLQPKAKVQKLSKGELSMVTIVLALASRAPVTILDEPTAGLDVVMREKFYRLLLDDHAETGRTFVISTHIIEEASAVFERVILLDEGRIIADCETDALLEQFRSLSGEEDAVNAALEQLRLTALQSENLGRHRMVTVRVTEAQAAELENMPGLTAAPISLQAVFVALCGHGDAEV